MSTKSILEQYKIHDFLSWNDDRTLQINRDFQRREIWAPIAKVMLIDSVLRGMPMPKIYLRTKVDLNTKRSVREIVDGQQRLKAIIQFASGELRLTGRAREFSGMTYDDLSQELKEDFLTYPIAVDQLINADDTDVLEVFARLNSYTVSLSPAEKRHAEFQGEFKWEVVNAAVEWRVLWDVLGIVRGRDRLRMKDDELVAEMYGFLIEGLQDGGASYINSLYKKYDDGIPKIVQVKRRFRDSLNSMIDNFSDLILETELRRSTQFLMFFAAYSSALESGIPVFPHEARPRLENLAVALDEEVAESAYFTQFVAASKGSTQRIATRKVRFNAYFWALTGRDEDGVGYGQ